MRLGIDLDLAHAAPAAPWADHFAALAAEHRDGAPAAVAGHTLTRRMTAPDGIDRLLCILGHAGLRLARGPAAARRGR